MRNNASVLGTLLPVSHGWLNRSSASRVDTIAFPPFSATIPPLSRKCVWKRTHYLRIVRFLRTLLASAGIALTVVLLASPDHITPADEFGLHLTTVASQERFDWSNWLVGAFIDKVESRLRDDGTSLSPSARMALVDQYFRLARDEEDLRAQLLQKRAGTVKGAELDSLETQEARKRADKLALEPQVEAIIAGQVEVAAQAEGLAQDLPFNPGLVLPPVAFKYVAPPLLLVISPHDQISTKASVHLLPGLTLSQIEQVEADADKLGVVSLVVPVGGIGTYPTMVVENSSYDSTLEIVSHEWTHNYLDVRPLGLHYGDSGAMQAINETTANLAGHELANLVRGLPVPSYADDAPAQADSPSQAADPNRFDFNQEMRQTRLAVDALLKDGRVQQAEGYMEERRQVFVAHGYALRKLNQAYFAFYGSYADGGVGAVNPIGGELKRLRNVTGSLKAYLDAISQVSTFDEYRALLRAKGVPEGQR